MVKCKTRTNCVRKKDEGDKATERTSSTCTNSFGLLGKYGGKSYDEIMESINGLGLDFACSENANKKTEASENNDQSECHKPNQKSNDEYVENLTSVKKNKSQQSKVLGEKIQTKKGKKEKKQNNNLVVNNNRFERCQKCFKTHFPYRKLCRWVNMGKWVNTKKKENEFLVEDSIMISEETIRQINDQISFLEKTKKTSR